MIVVGVGSRSEGDVPTIDHRARREMVGTLHALPTLRRAA